MILDATGKQFDLHIKMHHNAYMEKYGNICIDVVYTKLAHKLQYYVFTNSICTFAVTYLQCALLQGFFIYMNVNLNKKK